MEATRRYETHDGSQRNSSTATRTSSNPILPPGFWKEKKPGRMHISIPIVMALVRCRVPDGVYQNASIHKRYNRVLVAAAAATRGDEQHSAISFGIDVSKTSAFGRFRSSSACVHTTPSIDFVAVVVVSKSRGWKCNAPGLRVSPQGTARHTRRMYPTG